MAGGVATAPPRHPARVRYVVEAPVDVYVVAAGLLAHGSMLLSGLPETLAGFSDFVGQRLTAYSCGGSAGVTPASLLAPGKLNPENHDTLS